MSTLVARLRQLTSWSSLKPMPPTLWCHVNLLYTARLASAPIAVSMTRAVSWCLMKGPATAGTNRLQFSQLNRGIYNYRYDANFIRSGKCMMCMPPMTHSESHTPFHDTQDELYAFGPDLFSSWFTLGYVPCRQLRLWEIPGFRLQRIIIVARPLIYSSYRYITCTVAVTNHRKWMPDLSITVNVVVAFLLIDGSALQASHCSVPSSLCPCTRHSWFKKHANLRGTFCYETRVTLVT